MGEKKPYFDELDDVSADDVVIATEAQFDETTTSRTGATALRWVLTLIALLPVRRHGVAYMVACACRRGRVGQRVLSAAARGAGVGAFGGPALRQVHRVAGPGLIFMIPLVEYSAATVDMRIARRRSRPSTC